MKLRMIITLILSTLIFSCHAPVNEVVKNIKAYKLSNGYYITWDEVPGADYYNIYEVQKSYSTSSSSYQDTLSLIGTTYENSYRVSGSSYSSYYYSNSSYKYAVSAVIDGDESFLSDIISLKDSLNGYY